MQAPRAVRKRPVEVTAIRWNGLNTEQVKAFVGERQQHGEAAVPAGTGECGFLLGREISAFRSARGEAAVFDRFHDWVPLRLGDWIIRGVRGEFYPCEPEAFAASYEFVDESGSGLPSAAESKSSEVMM